MKQIFTIARPSNNDYNAYAVGFLEKYTLVLFLVPSIADRTIARLAGEFYTDPVTRVRKEWPRVCLYVLLRRQRFVLAVCCE